MVEGLRVRSFNVSSKENLKPEYFTVDIKPRGKGGGGDGWFWRDNRTEKKILTK